MAAGDRCVGGARAGTYREHVEVLKDRLKIISRTLRGAVIEKPADTQNSRAAVHLQGRGVLLRGFTITGVPPGGECGHGGEGVAATGGAATIGYNRIADSACQTFDRGVDLFSFGPGRITVAHNEISDVGSDSGTGEGIKARPRATPPPTRT